MRREGTAADDPRARSSAGKRATTATRSRSFRATAGSGRASTATSSTCATRSRRAARTRWACTATRSTRSRRSSIVRRAQARRAAAAGRERRGGAASRRRLGHREHRVGAGTGGAATVRERAEPGKSPAPQDEAVWTDHAFSEQLRGSRPSRVRARASSRPRLFSFNSPFGACPTCHGLGVILEFDEELVIPDTGRGAAQGRHRAVEEERAGRDGLPAGYLRGCAGRWAPRPRADGRTRRRHLPDFLMHGTTTRTRRNGASRGRACCPCSTTGSTRPSRRGPRTTCTSSRPSTPAPSARATASGRARACHARVGHAADTERTRSGHGHRSPTRRRHDPEHLRALAPHIDDAIAFIER